MRYRSWISCGDRHIERAGVVAEDVHSRGGGRSGCGPRGLLLPSRARRGVVDRYQPAIDSPPGGGSPEANIMCSDVVVFAAAVRVRRDAGSGEEIVLDLAIGASLPLRIFGLLTFTAAKAAAAAFLALSIIRCCL